jgi:hypothetical protein
MERHPCHDARCTTYGGSLNPLMGPPRGEGGKGYRPRILLAGQKLAGREPVWPIESPSRGLHSRPATSEIVEDGRSGRPCGPGAHSRASEKTSLRLRRHFTFAQGPRFCYRRHEHRKDGLWQPGTATADVPRFSQVRVPGPIGGRSALRTDRCRQKMWPDPDQFRYPFGGSGRVQHHAAVQRIGQPLVQVVQDKAHAPNGHQVQHPEPGAAQPGAELLGTMVVGRERSRIQRAASSAFTPPAGSARGSPATTRTGGRAARRPAVAPSGRWRRRTPDRQVDHPAGFPERLQPLVAAAEIVRWLRRRDPRPPGGARTGRPRPSTYPSRRQTAPTSSATSASAKRTSTPSQEFPSRCRQTHRLRRCDGDATFDVRSQIA